MEEQRCNFDILFSRLEEAEKEQLLLGVDDVYLIVREVDEDIQYLRQFSESLLEPEYSIFTRS